MPAEQRVFRPGQISYDAIAPNYGPARAVSEATADVWAAALEPFIRRSPPATVLDLGCGTGRFSSLIAERFSAQVVGVDPSFGMIRAGAARHVSAVAPAESIPLADASCDVVWLSQVIQHVVDREACASELRRILRPDGVVLIRGAFGDRLECCPTYFRFFPGALRIMAQLPTVGQVLSTFRSAGFFIAGFQSVTQKTCTSLRELAERTRQRTDTALVLLSDAEYAKCQADLDGAAEGEQQPQPVFEKVDLLILRLHGPSA